MTPVWTALLSTADADVGPPPKCGKGKHREYCQGNQCVTDGFTLDDDCNEIVDTDPPAPSSGSCAMAPDGGLMLAVLSVLMLRRRR